MKSFRVKNGLLVALIAVVPIAYYAGGISGFGKGYSAAMFSQSAEAGPTVFSLRRLRAGDAKATINFLELQLDGLLVQNDECRAPFHSVFNLPLLVGVGTSAEVDKNAGAALAYRTEFPSQAQPPLKAAIDRSLAHLAKHVHDSD
jgi:hypothetical protein